MHDKLCVSISLAVCKLGVKRTANVTQTIA